MKYTIEKLNQIDEIEANSKQEASLIFLEKNGWIIKELKTSNIIGIDISHHQGEIDFEKLKTDFVIIKATEGDGYIDQKFKQNQKKSREKFLTGYYHFAFSDKNSPEKEAQFFIKTIGEIKKDEFLVLDYERDFKNEVDWCLRFLNECQKLTGIKPLIYLDNSRLIRSDWSPVVKGDYGLWLARYYDRTGKLYEKKPKIKWWDFFVLWQFTSNGKIKGINGNVDMNIGYISLETLKKYGKK